MITRETHSLHLKSSLPGVFAFAGLRLACVAALLAVSAAAPHAQTLPIAQENPAKPATLAQATRVFLGPDGIPLPFQSDEEVLEFLRTAKVIQMRDIGRGVTRPRWALLEKDGIRLYAKFSDFEQEKDVAKFADGGREMFFRDSCLFEVAAYELGRLLGLDNLPPAVVRRVHGTTGSMQIRIEKTMDEKERMRIKLRPPDPLRWNRQRQVMRVFDNLIYNTDRTLENFLIDAEWKIWLIDHSRAFRRHNELRNPDDVVSCERGLYQKLQELDPEEVKRRLRHVLRSYEIEGLLKRREKLVAHIRQLIAEKGEDKVLFTW